MNDRRFAAPGENLQGRALRENEPSEQVAAAEVAAEEPAEVAAQPEEAAPVADSSASEPDRGDPRNPAVSQFGATQRLFQESATEKLRDRWRTIQGDFVDDPRHAVEEAASLVEQVARQLAESVSARQGELRDRWDTSRSAGSAAHDAGVSTEAMRIALQEYRRLLNRLLEV
ncbi:hypothetical protein ABIA33_003061 [Streptacidiphilus sp. MAP12-16]|uniref:hypothetical protein n=1 Tax=Streptacidiphilus sp. MAP12-16 TaxID=3156300 RepID=UPI00351885C6